MRPSDLLVLALLVLQALGGLGAALWRSTRCSEGGVVRNSADARRGAEAFGLVGGKHLDPGPAGGSR